MSSYSVESKVSANASNKAVSASLQKGECGQSRSREQGMERGCSLNSKPH